MSALPTDKTRDPYCAQQQIAKRDEEKGKYSPNTSAFILRSAPKRLAIQDLVKAVDYPGCVPEFRQDGIDWMRRLLLQWNHINQPRLP